MNKAHGIQLMTPEVEADHLELVQEIGIGLGRIPAATKRSIIVDKAESGLSNHIIALRYDVSPESVARIWKDFLDSATCRTLADEDPEKFKVGMRRKAVKAIEAGLDCDKDPYRQGSLGVAVMKGIGEFKSDDGSQGTRVNILIGAVPNEWKQRYVGISQEQGNGYDEHK